VRPGEVLTNYGQLLAALESLTTKGHARRPLVFLADEVGVRIQYESNGAIARVTWLDVTGILPPPSTVECTCHGALASHSDVLNADLPPKWTSTTWDCSRAGAALAVQLLATARRADPGTLVLVTGDQVSADILNQLRRRPQRGVYSSAPASAMDRRMAAEPTIAPLGNLLPRPRKTSSTRAQVPRHWEGFEQPPSCRATRVAVLRTVHDEPNLSRADLIQRLPELLCPIHSDSDLHVASGAALTETIDTEPTPNQAANPAAFDDLYELLVQNDAPQLDLRPSPWPLRAWQREALESWAAHCRHGVIEAVTGTGKTRVGIEAVKEALQSDSTAVIAVPTQTLMYQWQRELRTAGISAGLCGDGHHATASTHRTIVGVVNSLIKRDVLAGATNPLLVADECHRYGAATYQQVLDPRYLRRLGLTATYERSDDGIADLNAFFGGSPVFSIGYERAIREEVVAHYAVVMVGVEFDSEEREQYDVADKKCRGLRAELLCCGLPAEPFGLFMEAANKLAEDASHLLHRTAKDYLYFFAARREILASCSGKAAAMATLAPTIAASNGTLTFTQTIASAEAAAALLRERGIRAAAIHSEHNSTDRARLLQEFRAKSTIALVAPTILDEGVDVPEADLGIVVATTKSRRQMIQRMGRILRLKTDGRRGRFVVLYVKGTAEDPRGEQKAHEAFLDMITDHADAIGYFDATEAPAIKDFAAAWA
jgi:superfamily II DNA or RNA helicase